MYLPGTGVGSGPTGSRFWALVGQILRDLFYVPFCFAFILSHPFFVRIYGDWLFQLIIVLNFSLLIPQVKKR